MKRALPRASIAYASGFAAAKRQQELIDALRAWPKPKSRPRSIDEPVDVARWLVESGRCKTLTHACRVVVLFLKKAEPSKALKNARDNQLTDAERKAAVALYRRVYRKKP